MGYENSMMMLSWAFMWFFIGFLMCISLLISTLIGHNACFISTSYEKFTLHKYYEKFLRVLNMFHGQDA